jgi:hypothetical protein
LPRAAPFVHVEFYATATFSYDIAYAVSRGLAGVHKGRERDFCFRVKAEVV